MNSAEIKKYIYKNKQIEFVLIQIECHNIQYHQNKNYYSCSNYNGDNSTAINVKNNEYLNVKNWTREKEFNENADIITLVEYNKNLSFVESLKYLHNILGIEYKWTKQSLAIKENNNPLLVFTKHLSKNQVFNDVSDIQFLNENILNNYVPLLHINWFREGVMPWTAKKFRLGYSYSKKRVIIPLRHWRTGLIMGTNARTTVENYDEFGIRKYFITPSYPKSLNLFGLYENKANIEKSGYVVITESEKSVLKRDSLNDSTFVALSGHTISTEQVNIILSLNIYEVIIALDNDISIDEIRHICHKFYNKRKVSYIYDKWKLLGDKDSPADAENKIYQFLFKNRVLYDAEEERKYKQSLQRK